MKKITKLFLVLGMVLLVAMTTSVSLFSEEPSLIETDLQKSMNLIKSNNPKEYLNFYQKVLNTYSKDDVVPFIVLHLKYLYLSNNEKEFKTLLNAFPDDYVFHPYLEVKGKQIEYISMLKNQADVTKEDLLGLWQKIKELDEKVEKLIKTDNYEPFIEMVDRQNVGYILSGAYGSFEGVWASTIDYEDGGCNHQNVRYDFLVKKAEKIVAYLLANFKNHDTNENLGNLLGKDIGPAGSSKANLFLESKNLSKSEIESLKKTLNLFQKGQLPLEDYSYDKNEGNYVFQDLNEETLAKWEKGKISIKINTGKKKDSLVPGTVEFLSKNYASLYLGSSYGDSTTSDHFLIFKKENGSWKPIIKHSWTQGGGC